MRKGRFLGPSLGNRHQWVWGWSPGICMLNVPPRGTVMDNTWEKHHGGKRVPSQEPVVSEMLGSLASYLIPPKTQKLIPSVGH